MGPNQFAYCPGRGSRDAILLYLITWIIAIDLGNKVGAFCSDVSGAFDHVPSSRLLRKLCSKGLHLDILRVISSWLEPRPACVVVEGCSSSGLGISNMVFQGTVWGATLWNSFFEDARRAITSSQFAEIVYADDLNCYRAFPRCTPSQVVMDSIDECQTSLHAWGRANQVRFDASKENKLILDPHEPVGPTVKLLGILIDPDLRMVSAINDCAQEASWRLRTLLRSRRFFTNREILLHFKSHVLSHIEYRTPGIFHASTTALRPVDNILSCLLRDLDISLDACLHEFNLASLSTRRDIAMLAVIHRAVLHKGPPHFFPFF